MTQAPPPSRGLERLRAVLADPAATRTRRLAAIKRLATSRRTGTLDVLGQAAALPHNADILKYVVRAMGCGAKPGAAQGLLPFLDHPSRSVVACAVRALLEIDRALGLREALGVLTHGDLPVAAATARTMARQCPRETARLARKLAGSRAARDRIAAHMMWRFLPRTVGPAQALAALESEHDRGVVEVALRLLARSLPERERPRLEAVRLLLQDTLVREGDLPGEAKDAVRQAQTPGAGGAPQPGPRPIADTPGPSAEPAVSTPGPPAGPAVGTPGPRPEAAPGTAGTSATAAAVPPAPSSAAAATGAAPSEARPAADQEPVRPSGRVTRPLSPPPEVGTGAGRGPAWLGAAVLAAVAIGYGAGLFSGWTGSPGPIGGPRQKTGESLLGRAGDRVRLEGTLLAVHREHGILMVLEEARRVVVSAQVGEQPIERLEAGGRVRLTGTIGEVRTPRLIVLQGSRAEPAR